MAAAIVALAALGGAQAHAQNNGVMVVDRAQVLRESRAGADMSTKLQTINDTITQEYETRAAPVQRAAEGQTQEQIRTNQRLMQDIRDLEALQTRQELERYCAQYIASKQVSEALNTAIRQVMTDRRAGLVFDKSGLVIDEGNLLGGFDATADVLGRINRNVQTINVRRVSLSTEMVRGLYNQNGQLLQPLVQPACDQAAAGPTPAQ